MDLDELWQVSCELAELWALPELLVDLRIEFSMRMTRSLGRCLLIRRVVRLNGGLREAPRDLVRGVLCHELAHLAVFLRFGSRAKPHGSEWRELVELAGYTAQRRVPRVLDAEAQRIPPRPGAIFEHRCPVCQSVRIARTARQRWRCAECSADGLDGELTVSRIYDAGDKP